MDPKGKGKVTNNKDKIPINDEPKGEKPVDSRSNKKEGIKKKHIKKTTKTSFNHTPLNYSHISRSSNTWLLSIPLGKPPHFYGEDYSWWSHKLHSHLL
jgi:hypothetical protein